MINLDFFPSRQLVTYTVKLFITRSIAVLAALVLILMTLDLLGESGKILAVPGNGDAELWRYVSLRIPMLVSRFLPFSVLLGTLIAFTGLNQHSEVIAMKAAGISAHQILAPFIAASVAVAGAAFVFNETVVVKATRTVTAWSDNDYRPIQADKDLLSNVWMLVGDDLFRARQVTGRGDKLRATGVTLYVRENGVLLRTISADRARPEGGAWLLENVRIFDRQSNRAQRLQSMTGLAGVEPDRLTLARVDADTLNFSTLKERIEELDRAGRPAEEARAGLWHKISSPLSVILMPLLAAVAAFGLARSGQLLLRAVIGMALGFAYFVADSFSLAMGNVGAYPPLLAAWAPFVLFLLIGESVLIRSEE